MSYNQQKNLDSIVLNNKFHLRGGGSSFSCCNSNKKKNKTKIDELNQILRQLKYTKGEAKQQVYSLIKNCLDLIVNIYKNEIEKNTFIIEKEFSKQLNKYKVQINDIMNVQDSSGGKCCLDYYFELIIISLENLSIKVPENESISIISLFVQISKEKKNVQSISQLIEAAKLLLIDVQCRYYYQFQKFETYFFFNTLKYIIKEQIVLGLEIEVQKYFDQIKGQYIQNSTNWTLHNCWIEFLVDLLIFCNQFQQNQRSNEKGIQKTNEIIKYITDQEWKSAFDCYLQEFKYSELLENKWISLENPGLHRLNKILNVLSGLVKSIETQHQEFLKSKDVTQVQQIFHSLHSDFLVIQICLLEISQQFYEEQEKFRLNRQEQSEKFKLMENLIKDTKSLINYNFNIESIVNCYCQLQMMNINNFNKDRFQQNPFTLNLESQIQQLSKLVQIISTFIIQERILSTNQTPLQNNQLLSTPQLFGSYIYDSINEKVQIFESLEEISCQINIHLLLYQNIELLQKIFHLKLKQHNLNVDQNSIQQIINKIIALEVFKQKLPEIQQLTSSQEELIAEKPNYCVEQFVIEGQILLDNQYLNISLSNFYSRIRYFWHEQELPLIYELLYQQIEQIVEYQNNDEWKVIECIIFHFSVIEDKPENKELIYSAIQLIQIFLKTQNALQQLDPQKQQMMQVLESSINNYHQLSSNNQNKQATQEFSNIWKIVNSVFELSTETSLVSINSNIRLQKEKKYKLKKKNYVELMAKQQYQDSQNHILEAVQSKQLFIEFQAEQNPQDFLDAEINNFIWCKKNRNAVLVVSGQIGCGKTNTLKRLQKLLQQLNRDKSTGQNWIPIYINLPDVKNPKDKLLMQAFKINYPQSNQNYMEEFYSAIKGTKNIVLMLDGYDQQNEYEDIIRQNKLQRRIKNFYKNVSLKIIISTRGDILPFRNFENTLKIQFTKIQLFNITQQQKYQEESYKRQIKINIMTNLQNQNNNNDQVENKIDQLFKQSEENFETDFISNLIEKFKNMNDEIEHKGIIWDQMKKMKYFQENILSHLKDILLTPLLLKIASKILYQKFWTAFEQGNSKIQIEDEFKKLKPESCSLSEDNFRLRRFEQFFNEYHLYDTPYLENKDSINLNGKVFTVGDDADLFLLAINEQRFSKYVVLEQFINICHNYKIREDENNYLQVSSQALSILLKLNSLNEQQSQTNSLNIINNVRNSRLITYNNSKIQFLNQQILDFFFAQHILKLLQNLQENETMLFFKNDFNLSEKQFEGVVELLIDQLIKIDQLTKFLIKIVKKSKNNVENIRASSNGIFLLSKMEICLIDENFEGIMIENTNIKGLHAIRCDFRNSKMTNVEINLANFVSCQLASAQFENVIWCEFPTIQEDEEVIQAISYQQNKLLVVLKKNGIAKIWNIKNRERLQAHIQNLVLKQYKQIIISKDETILFALTEQQIDLWNLSNYQFATYSNFQYKIISLCLSPDNKYLLCSSNEVQEIKVWFVNDLTVKQTTSLNLSQYVEQMAINHSNQLLVFKNTSNQIYYLNMQTSIEQQIQGDLFTTTKDGRSLIIQHQNNIIFYKFEIPNGNLVQAKCFSIAFTEPSIGLHISDNSQTILIQAMNLTTIFDTSTEKVQYLQKKFNGKNSVISRDGQIFINWKQNKVQLYDLKTLSISKQDEEIDCEIRCQYSPNGQNLLMQSYENSLFFLNIATKTHLCILESISSFCFNPKKNMLVTFSKQGLKFWSTKTNNQIQLLYYFDEFQYFEQQKLIFSQDGNWLACINNSIVRFMNINCKQENVKTFDIKQLNLKKIIAISPKGNFYALASSDLIYICQCKLSTLVTKFQFSSIILSLNFSSDENYFASRSQDALIRIRDTVNFSIICQLQDNINHQIENYCYWVSGNQTQYIVTNFENLVVYFELSKKQLKEINKLEQKDIPNEFKCRNIAISKDNLLIAISYAKDSEASNQMASIIIRHAVPQNEIIHQFNNNGGFKLAFCPNTKYLATNSYQNNQSQVIIWDINCEIANQSFIISTNSSNFINSMAFSPSNNYLLISDDLGNFSLYDHSISILIDHNEQITQNKNQNLTLRKVSINSYCKFSIQGESLVYIQHDKLKLEKIDRLKNIKLISNYNYNEKDQFNYSQDLVSYSFDKQQLIKFNPDQCSYSILRSFQSKNYPLAFSSSGEYMAHVNQVEQNISIFIQKINHQRITNGLQVTHPIDVLQFSNDEMYLVTFSPQLSQIDIYSINNNNNNSQPTLNFFQSIKINQRLLSLQFHPKDHQFLVISKNGEMFFYIKRDQEQIFQKIDPNIGQLKLQSANTLINCLQINSKINQQNFHQSLVQQAHQQ